MPTEERIHHIPYDLNYHAKQHGSALLDSLVPLLDACLDVTGLLVHTPSAGPQVAPSRLQLRASSRLAAPCLAASYDRTVGTCLCSCDLCATAGASSTFHRSCC